MSKRFSVLSSNKWCRWQCDENRNFLSGANSSNQVTTTNIPTLSYFFTSQMHFLLSNKRCRNNEGRNVVCKEIGWYWVIFFLKRTFIRWSISAIITKSSVQTWDETRVCNMLTTIIMNLYHFLAIHLLFYIVLLSILQDVAYTAVIVLYCEIFSYNTTVVNSACWYHLSVSLVPYVHTQTAMVV